MLERYVIVERIAVGGMGEVFVARQQGVGGFRRTVVLKHLLPGTDDDEATDRLLDEARIIGALSHDNVVSIIEVGEKDDRPFLALEYVHGDNAGTLRNKAGKRAIAIPIVVAARIVADSARGLHHAHTANDVDGRPLRIIHRDIAPKNIFVRHDGVSKVGDFGIARADARLSHTATGAVAGTLTYMSPEQLTSKELTPRSDQFALGIVFWELLTGRRLFRGDGPVQVAEKILEGKIRAPSRYRPDVPAAVDAIVLRMLQRDTSKRYPDMGEVADDVEAALPDAAAVVGRAAVAAFVELMVGDDLRERLRRIEEGAEQTARSERPSKAWDDPSSSRGKNQASSQQSAVFVDDGDPTRRELAVAPPAPTSATSATAATPQGARQPQPPPRSRAAAAAAAAAVVVVVVALVIAAVFFTTRPTSEEEQTRAYLARKLVIAPLTFKDYVVVDAADAGIDRARAEQLADALTILLEKQLRLASAHYALSAADRQRARVAYVLKEQTIAAEVTTALGAFGTPEFRADVLDTWRADSRAPLRWYEKPSLDEVQQRLYPAGIEFIHETRIERQQQVDRMAARLGADPKAVQNLVRPLVLEREALIERFGTAPAEELAGLEVQMRAVVVRGIAALRTLVANDYAEAIAAVAFVGIPDTQVADPFIEESR
ncbi:MAG: serine/threonine-protein kinase [Deltaproteobacteria bacterium]|nr:serine/threonine-protein kinase [Deltaproteobacteria bacterium]